MTLLRLMRLIAMVPVAVAIMAIVIIASPVVGACIAFDLVTGHFATRGRA